MASNRMIGLAIGLASALLLSACSELETDGIVVGSIIPPSDQRPQDEPVRQGKLNFAAGDYGLAARQFQQAVEANPKSAEAWLGLAASYDRLRRFDLSERAYNRVVALVGRAPEVLNNLAYHNMLKGNLARARTLLAEAAEKDPGNVVVQGNMYLLDTWKTGDPAPPPDCVAVVAPDRECRG